MASGSADVVFDSNHAKSSGGALYYASLPLVCSLPLLARSNSGAMLGVDQHTEPAIQIETFAMKNRPYGPSYFVEAAEFFSQTNPLPPWQTTQSAVEQQQARRLKLASTTLLYAPVLPFINATLLASNTAAAGPLVACTAFAALCFKV